jgi:predicted dinucleotide-binding enzyme
VILAIPFPKVPELTAVVADWSDEGRQAVFFATEDHAAGTVVGQYVTRLGFAPLSLGGPHDGGRLMQLGGALNAVHVIRQD